MSEREFQKGEFLYRDGDRSDTIYIVVEGSVEILKLISDTLEVVGTAKPGDFVGEIASLIDRKRATSARVAQNGTRLRTLEKEKFLRLVSSDPDTAYNVINRICERLHASSRRSTDDVVHQAIRTAQGQNDSTLLGDDVLKMKPKTHLTIFPDTDFLFQQMPKEGIALMSSPFIVGRMQDAEETDPEKTGNWLGRRKDRRRANERRLSNTAPQVQLQLTDTQPFRLSRVHFLIQKMPDGGFIVRDLGSALGSQVNDTSLGTDFPCDFVELQIGENFISAGGMDSVYKFRIVIEPH